ncbi:MAG TPA: phosphatidate cytidylyltransferase [Phycisphaerae bacterium]|nr:phosphatidate cytidylyltransferase [Phycisphaerae bacterium]HRW51390.1 phosphatidate cytidylyltransferase [Phycisphaerae bacterium]
MIVTLSGLLYADARWSGPVATHAPVWLHNVSGMIAFDGFLVFLTLAILVLLGTRELGRLLAGAGHSPLSCWPMAVNLALIAIPFVAGNGPPANRDLLRLADMQWTVGVLALGVIGTGFLVMRRRRTEGASGAMGATLLSILYLGLLGQFLVRIRMFGPVGSTWLLLYVVATVKVCDIGAFFTGMAIGRHKMIEWLSPKKTLEGLAGGVAASIAVAVLTPIIVDRLAPASSALRGLFPSLAVATIFGLLMAIVGQGGDLVESLFKRDAKAKDSANAIPAFGGVLDVLDSPLWAAPVAWWLLIH